MRPKNPVIPACFSRNPWGFASKPMNLWIPAFAGMTCFEINPTARYLSIVVLDLPTLSQRFDV